MERPESLTGFYYIGTNRENIEKLVKIYKRGYAADNLQDTFRELSRENFFPPDVICCESRFGLTAIRDFARLLAGHPALSRIPFIVDAENMSIEDRSHYIRHELVDDILSISACDDNKLVAKINFLNKFKLSTYEPGGGRTAIFSGDLPSTLHDVLKRGFDVLVAAAALILLSPVLLLIALLIKIDSRGPVFYVSQRAGKGYRIFNFFKFRTMFAGAEHQREGLMHLNQYRDVPETLFFKVANDPRCTRIGRFLRKTSMDELPQLLNVLRGDMSLVGNRPLPLYEAASLTTDDLARRFLAPAGITGLWQIKKRGNHEMSVQERIVLDIDYASKYNFMYDLWIMAHTPQALLQKASS